MARFMSDAARSAGAAASATTARACSAGPGRASPAPSAASPRRTSAPQSRSQAARDAARGRAAQSFPTADARTRSTRKLDEAFERRHARRGRTTPRSWPSGPRRTCGVEVDADAADRRDAGRGPQRAVERLRRALPPRDAAAWSAACSWTSSTRPWKNHLYDDGPPALRASAWSATPRSTRRPSTSAQGMKEFDAMWDGVADKVTDTVFRMEDDEAFQESVWSIGAARPRAAAPRPDARRRASRPSSKQPSPAASRRQEDRADPQPRRRRSAATTRARAAAARSTRTATCARRRSESVPVRNLEDGL